MDQYLRVSILSSIKLRVRTRGIINPDLVRYHEGWLSTARDDHIAKVAIVSLDIALASTDRESLESD